MAQPPVTRKQIEAWNRKYGPGTQGPARRGSGRPPTFSDAEIRKAQPKRARKRRSGPWAKPGYIPRDWPTMKSPWT